MNTLKQNLCIQEQSITKNLKFSYLMTLLKNLLAAIMTVAIVGVVCLWRRFSPEGRSLVAEFRPLEPNTRSELNMSELTTIKGKLLPSTTFTPSLISCCCGQLCSNDLPSSQSKFFDFIKKEFDCEELWSNSAIDQSRTGPVIRMKNIPQKMLVNFTYNGLVPIRTWHMYDQAYLGRDADTPVWEAAIVDDWSRRCANGTLDGNYGMQQTAYLLQGLKQVATISNANVMVIGSENPWVEACVLSAGASNVTTLEYGKIESRHPRIITLSPDEMRSRFSDMYERFDVIVTFSSVEHAGLGRYGDRLNPWGDRQAIARAWCATKPGGYLVIGVPFGDDAIEYNEHRIYGKIMYPHLVANWYQQWRADDGFHRVHVLRKSIDGVTDPGMPADAGKSTWVSAALDGRLGNQMFIAASSFGIARARNANWCIYDFSGSDLDQSVHFTVPFPSLDCPAELEYTDELEGKANQRFVGSFMDGKGKDSVRVGTYLQSWMYFSTSGVPFKLKDAEWAERWVQKGSFDVGIHVRADESGQQTPISFYIRALVRLQGLLRGAKLTFVIASNNPSWVRQHEAFRGMMLTENLSPAQDMAILASCKHLIIGWGTFGWWAAFLKKKHGHVIHYNAPWNFDNAESFDLAAHYPPSWITINATRKDLALYDKVN